VRGYAAMVAQLTADFHAETGAVQETPASIGALAEKVDHEAAAEEEVLRMYACVVLDFGERFKSLKKRHVAVRDRLTTAAVVAHAAAAREQRSDDTQTTAGGGMSLRVSMVRELQELSSIAAGGGFSISGRGGQTGAADLSDMLDFPPAIESAIESVVEYSGREEAVMDGLAELSVSTVGGGGGDDTSGG